MCIRCVLMCLFMCCGIECGFGLVLELLCYQLVCCGVVWIVGLCRVRQRNRMVSRQVLISSLKLLFQLKWFIVQLIRVLVVIELLRQLNRLVKLVVVLVVFFGVSFRVCKLISIIGLQIRKLIMISVVMLIVGLLVGFSQQIRVLMVIRIMNIMLVVL